MVEQPALALHLVGVVQDTVGLQHTHAAERLLGLVYTFIFPSYHNRAYPLLKYSCILHQNCGGFSY